VPPARTTVLVVEDEPALRTFYRSALMLAGFRVVTAEDGIDALQKVEGYRPAAVVLDLGLPRMSGRDVSRELLAHHGLRDVPVVVVTGSDTSDLDEGQFACVLRKPVTPEALIRAVEECIRRGSGP
jgi:CheY-like chemotaxis protein